MIAAALVGSFHHQVGATLPSGNGTPNLRSNNKQVISSTSSAVDQDAPSLSTGDIAGMSVTQRVDHINSVRDYVIEQMEGKGPDLIVCNSGLTEKGYRFGRALPEVEGESRAERRARVRRDAKVRD